MPKEKEPTDIEIMAALANVGSALPAISVNGKSVDPVRVLQAVQQSAVRPASSFALLFKWLCYSAGLAIVLLCCAKAFGLVAAGKLSLAEFEQEMILHGDLLLISAAFACETIGSLLSSDSSRQGLKSTVGFLCLVSLIISLAIIACCGFLPSDPPTANAAQQAPPPDPHTDSTAATKNIIRYSTLPVFVITLIAVSATKLRKEE